MSLHKKALRDLYKAKRANFFSTTPESHAEESQKICSAALDFISGVPTVGCYYPLPGEVDTRFLIRALHRRRIPIALPRVTEPGLLAFHHWCPDTPLVQGSHNTWHPSKACPVVSPSIFFLPLLAFGPNGERLGYGKGYYDKSLAETAQTNALLIGLSFSWCFDHRLTAESHDIPMDAVVTETQTIKFSSERKY